MVPLPDFIRQLTPPTGFDPLPKLLHKPDFQNVSFSPDYDKLVEVGWLSIDQNQHINNVAYVGWLLEAVPDTLLQTQELAELDLVFRIESHWRDQLNIQSVAERIIRKESGKEVLLACSHWL